MGVFGTNKHESDRFLDYIKDDSSTNNLYIDTQDIVGIRQKKS
jgi:hypothetical protein